MSVLEIASPIAGAATAASGLILVFLGATAAAFESYEPRERRSVVAKFQRRALHAFLTLVLAVTAAVAALIAAWLKIAALALLSFWLLIVSLLGVLFIAFRSMRDIRVEI